MTLRPAQMTDAASLAAISLEVWVGTYLRYGVGSFFAEYALETFTTAKTAALIADPAQFILVSQNDEGPDGFIRLAAGSSGPVEGCSDMEIATFYVQPRHHGKGIGRKLLNGLYDHCRAQGIRAVWLTTNAENAPAIGFYMAQGFIHRGTTHFSIGDRAYPNNVYTRDID